MQQSPDEPARSFCSRLVGTAELCDLFVTCSKEGCDQKTSYRDQVVLQALLKGMHDTDIRTRVLSRTQNEELKTLPADEASSASFSSFSSPHTIAGTRSSYKRLQTQRDCRTEPIKCRFCGGRHPGDMSSSSRQQHCKAYDKKCTSCDKPHHFASVCRSTPKTTAATMATPPGPVTGALV